MVTMDAIRTHARGGAEQLRHEQAPMPILGGDEALVRVHATAITYYDVLLWEESWTRDGRTGLP